MEVFDIHTCPVPDKITSSLRHVKSEERLNEDTSEQQQQQQQQQQHSRYKCMIERVHSCLTTLVPNALFLIYANSAAEHAAAVGGTSNAGLHESVSMFSLMDAAAVRNGNKLAG